MLKLVVASACLLYPTQSFSCLGKGSESGTMRGYWGFLALTGRLVSACLGPVESTEGEPIRRLLGAIGACQALLGRLGSACRRFDSLLGSSVDLGSPDSILCKGHIASPIRPLISPYCSPRASQCLIAGAQGLHELRWRSCRHVRAAEGPRAALRARESAWKDCRARHGAMLHVGSWLRF